VTRTNQAHFPGVPVLIITDQDPAGKGARKRLKYAGTLGILPGTGLAKDYREAEPKARWESLLGEIERALDPPGTILESVRRLAALPRLEYEQVRKAEASRLEVRQTVLDQAVERARKDDDQDPANAMFPAIEPWDEPVDAAQLLDEIHATIKRHIICDISASLTAALWGVFTWFIDFVQVAPIAIITSPQKRCGKSLLLDLMSKLSRRPLVASNISPSAVFRLVERDHPTLLIDEADSFLKDNEEIRGIINSGHTRQSAFVIRVEGDDHVPTRFSTWSAKALCGIGTLPATIMDRSLVLKLRRKLKNEKVQRLRHADPEHFNVLVRKMARLVEDHGEAIGQARPQLPESLNDRAQDNWEPLLAIADLAGGDWPRMARNIAIRLSGDGDEDVETSTMLLFDIQSVFDGIAEEFIGGKADKRITTQILLAKLAADDTRPWATFDRNGGRMTPRQLSELLKPFGIKPTNLCFAGNVVQKGYRLDQFEDTFTRYLAPQPPREIIEEIIPLHTPPNIRYAASNKETCGSTHSGSLAAEDVYPLDAEDTAGELADESAIRYESAMSEPAETLPSSGIAVKKGSAETYDSESLSTAKTNGADYDPPDLVEARDFLQGHHPCRIRDDGSLWFPRGLEDDEIPTAKRLKPALLVLLKEAERDEADERASIVEIDAGLTRAEAERRVGVSHGK
jgi:putative DNA primase/helicase